MALKYTSGDIFDSGADILVNPVNCQGVMGKGLALEFKNRFPSYYDWYRMECVKVKFRPGDVAFFENEQAICSAFTKNHWREPSQLVWIRRILKTIRYSLNGESIAIPALGCGLGGLRWADVKPLFEPLENMPEDIFVYEPGA